MDYLRLRTRILALAFAASAGSWGCGFSAYVTPARRLTDIPEAKSGVELQMAGNLVFHCYYPTIWGRASYECGELQQVASGMINDASVRLRGGGKEEVHEEVLEMSFEEHWNPGPLTFLRGLASFVTALSPISISEAEGRWTLEVRTTSTLGKTIERNYETSSFRTGSVYLALISIPAPPENARRLVVRKPLASGAAKVAKRESLRSLVAGFIVDSAPRVCDGLSCEGCSTEASATGASEIEPRCLDCEALRAACVP